MPSVLVRLGHRRESRILKAQIPVLKKHACQHRFATNAGILVLGAFCPCGKFAHLGHGKVRAKGVPALHGSPYQKCTFRTITEKKKALPKRCNASRWPHPPWVCPEKQGRIGTPGLRTPKYTDGQRSCTNWNRSRTRNALGRPSKS